MAKRLVKIAKELNVGTSTIVDHLVQAGYEIENKPTAKVDDDMYAELLKEFSGTMAVKEKADSMVIGTRKKEEEVEAKAPLAPAPPVTPPPAPKPEKKPEPAPSPAEEKVIQAETPKVTGPKVLGKIDLDKKKPAAKKEEPKKEEKKAKAPEKKVEKPGAKKEEPAKAKEEEKEEMVRAKTPTLKGLKILGKVDASKLEEKKKKPSSDKKDSKDANAKRKRRRRKVNPNADRFKGGNKRGGKRDDVKEVTQKQIDEKIKATMARLSGGGKKNKRQKIRRENRDRIREKTERQEAAQNTGVVQVTEFVTVSELAGLFDIDVSEVIMACMNLGVIVSINQRLDAEIIELIASEFETEIEFVSAEEETSFEDELEDDPELSKPRAPIVTVMGHVDHGKTSLLDYIREANVASGEAGGITQHIGAYEVRVGPDRKPITFLDTPGHEAFTAMRARGAKVTDIAIIIVSADDNVMPQTKEAISHAQAAGVPMVFAINKIDKAGADPERIKQELATMNILVEDWGGKYQSQDISAKTGQNIEELLEKVILEAELLDLKANPDRNAMGTVVEASLDKGRGYVTKLLVQTGTLKIGDPMVAGEHSGKVKAMFNERGKKVKKAGPAAPVLVLGLSGAPQAGEWFKVADSEQEARTISQRRSQIAREQTNRASKRISLEEIGRRLALGTFKELNIIVKGDVDGSVEALSDALIKQSVETVQVNVIHKAVGQIIESDVLLASASDAIIIGFQVRPSMGARKLAEREGVEIKSYSIIYEAIEEIRAAMEGLLEAKEVEEIIGQVDVRETYKISKVGTIAGCYVSDGKVHRNAHVRLIREGIVVYPTKEGVTGEISSLKRFKDDIKEVKTGMECGISIKNFNDIKVGDVIEVYEVKEVKQTLEG